MSNEGILYRRDPRLQREFLVIVIQQLKLVRLRRLYWHLYWHMYRVLRRRLQWRLYCGLCRRLYWNLLLHLYWRLRGRLYVGLLSRGEELKRIVTATVLGHARATASLPASIR